MASSTNTYAPPAELEDVPDTILASGVSPRRMLWQRFLRHRVAVVALVLLAMLYVVALFPGFFAYSDPNYSNAYNSYVPPQPIHFLFDGGLVPYVYALSGARNPQTYQRTYTPERNHKLRITFFARGFPYKILGLIPTDRHLIGLAGGDDEDRFFLLGTDEQGRDLWSRIVYGAQISLSIGLVAVAISLVLGMLFGGISGYFGGVVDLVVQRVIEIVRSLPTIPLWLALAASVPRSWSVVQVYFAITILIGLLGWTEMARIIRGRFLVLREEEFVVAAVVSGSRSARIIRRHLMPMMLGYIIAAVTLAIPDMIISETALSFLGLGLRPPAISWGVLLQSAENVQTVALAPWLMIPAACVAISVLAFNFAGDGLRDAADPHGV